MQVQPFDNLERERVDRIQRANAFEWFECPSILSVESAQWPPAPAGAICSVNRSSFLTFSFNLQHLRVLAAGSLTTEGERESLLSSWSDYTCSIVIIAVWRQYLYFITLWWLVGRRLFISGRPIWFQCIHQMCMHQMNTFNKICAWAAGKFKTFKLKACTGSTVSCDLRGLDTSAWPGNHHNLSNVIHYTCSFPFLHLRSL